MIQASRLEEEVLHLRQQQLMPSLPGQQQPEQQPEQAMDSCGADAGLETYSNEQSNQGGTPTAQAQARGQGLSASQRDTPLPVHMHMHGSARLSDDAQQALQQHCAFLLACEYKTVKCITYRLLVIACREVAQASASHIIIVIAACREVAQASAYLPTIPIWLGPSRYRGW